jgi:drug/metabolite transporter (DMT)-like permease
MALLGFLGIALAYGTFAWSMQTSLAANAAIIIATAPAITHLLLTIGWREKPGGYQILGLVLAFTGLALVFTQGSLQRLLLLHFQPADLVLVVNVISVSLYNITGQRVMMKGYSPTITSTYTVIFGALFLLPGSLWEITRQGWHLSPFGWLLLVYMGCFIAGIAVLLNFLAISRLGSALNSMFSNLTPLFALALSALILNEQLYWYHAISVMLVLGGVILSLKPQATSKTSRSSSRITDHTPF